MGISPLHDNPSGIWIVEAPEDNEGPVMLMVAGEDGLPDPQSMIVLQRGSVAWFGYPGATELLGQSMPAENQTGPRIVKINKPDFPAEKSPRITWMKGGPNQPKVDVQILKANSGGYDAKVSVPADGNGKTYCPVTVRVKNDNGEFITIVVQNGKSQKFSADTNQDGKVTVSMECPNVLGKECTASFVITKQ